MKDASWMEASLCALLDKIWTPCISRCTVMLLLMSTLILSGIIEALQVIGGNMTVVQGGTVVLPCKLVDTTEEVTQISWQRMTREKLQNENFFTVLSTNGPEFLNGEDRFEFIGSVKDNNGSLQLSRVTLMDEGTYTCIFTLFPSGNHKTEIPLNVLVPPVMHVEDNRPTLGDEEVSLVTCTAAASKPPAEARWLTGTLNDKVRETTSSTKHANGTTTTVSTLLGVPTREINQHLVRCVVTSAALLKKETLPFTTQVYFPPTEVNITKTSEDSFECVTEANPNADFTWSRSDQPSPQSAIRVEGAKLQFLSMNSDLNGLYQCEASNQYGRKRGTLYVQVTSGACTACWTLFGLLLFLHGAAAVWYLYNSGKFPRTGQGTRGNMHDVPTTPCTPKETKREAEEAERLQAELQDGTQLVCRR